MIRLASLTILILISFPCAAAEPVLLYGQNTGGFWLAGIDQTDQYAGLTLYSQSGALLFPEQTYFITGVPLDSDPLSPTYGQWIRKEIGISIGRRYLPLYLGNLAQTGTPSDDFSAIYYPGKFIPSQPLAIQIVPEPRTLYFAALALLFALCTQRQKRPLRCSI